MRTRPDDGADAGIGVAIAQRRVGLGGDARRQAANDLGGLLLVLMFNGFPAAVVGALFGGSCGLWFGNRFTGD